MSEPIEKYYKSDLVVGAAQRDGKGLEIANRLAAAYTHSKAAHASAESFVHVGNVSTINDALQYANLKKGNVLFYYGVDAVLSASDSASSESISVSKGNALVCTQPKTNGGTNMFAVLGGGGGSSSGGGSSLTDDQLSALNALVEEKNPLTITATGANVTYEVGTVYSSPGGTITVKKGSTDVTSQSTLSISSGTISGSSWADSNVSTDKTWTISATYNGKTVSTSRSVSFKHYLYSGVLNSNPSGDEAILSAITSASKALSDSKTLGATNLSAGKYYIFAVCGDVTLVCRENSTNGIVSAVTGKITVQRINESGSDEYSYIIVPASDSNWTFKITNS